MKKALLLFLLVVIGVAGYKLVPQMGGPSPIEGNDKDLYQLAEKLKPLHEKMGPVQDGDWLASHKEDGQTFREYVGSRHVSLTEDRNVLYVQPIGEFNEHHSIALLMNAICAVQTTVLNLTAAPFSCALNVSLKHPRQTRTGQSTKPRQLILAGLFSFGVSSA